MLFSLQHTPTETLHLPGLTASSPLPGQTGTARVDLMLTLLETQQGLRAHLEYSTDLFESATIARLAAHYQRLLEAMVADPAQRLADLPLLTQAERQLLLLDWNATRQAYPHDICLPQLFEAQVARTPDAIALVSQDEQFSYHDLNCRANQLAHLLLAHGIGPEHIVGLCLERSPDLLIALLAILKTGAAYLPLDPRYPTQRLAFMLADAHASLLLTHQSWLQHHALPETTTLCLETLSGEHDEARSYSLANPHPPLLPENLAYVIYTSGSTGQPKGVAITHRSACALLTWAQRVFAPALLRGMLASTSICFDLSVFELLLPLSSGGTVLLVDDLLHLPGTPAAQALTLLNTVPSVLAAFLAAAPLPPTLRTVTLAGETLPADLLHRLYALPAIAQVYNLYGPSEDTTYSTCALLAPTATDPLPIGHPIANSQAYVLDPQGQPVPIGVVGELYLGGAGLARGYLGQPALTAERFLPDPFSGAPGARLYRTGDLVRCLPDGTLVFLGRADSQVKLRGYRIELGEIEAVLRQHASVRAAVVALREDTAGDRRLVAYVVPQAQPVPQAELRAFLAHKLPDYMLPAAFVVTGGPAALAQRQAGPERAACPWSGSDQRKRSAMWPRARPWRSCWSASGPRCWAWSALASMTISSRWEDTPCSPPRSWRGCARPGRQTCLCAHSLKHLPSPVWPSALPWHLWMSKACVFRLYAPSPARRPCRSPLPSSGCGSWVIWSRRARPTICPWPCASRGPCRSGP